MSSEQSLNLAFASFFKNENYSTINSVSFYYQKKDDGGSSYWWEINGQRLPKTLLRLALNKAFDEDDEFRSWCVELGLNSQAAHDLMIFLVSLPRYFNFGYYRKDFE